MKSSQLMPVTKTVTRLCHDEWFWGSGDAPMVDREIQVVECYLDQKGKIISLAEYDLLVEKEKEEKKKNRDKEYKISEEKRKRESILALESLKKLLVGEFPELTGGAENGFKAFFLDVVKDSIKEKSWKPMTENGVMGIHFPDPYDDIADGLFLSPSGFTELV